MRARKFIASLVLSAALAVGALPSAAFADDAARRCRQPADADGNDYGDVERCRFGFE